MEEFLVLILFCFFLVALLVLLFILILSYQYDRPSRALVAQIRNTQSPILCFYAWGRCEIKQLNSGASLTRGFIVVIKPGEIAIFPRKPKIGEPFIFAPEQIRWFGRPQKYSTGRNDLWLHIEIGGDWHLVKFRLYEGMIRDLVRGLKAVASDELVTAYRRRRPYIHEGPARGQPAAQDIHGAWTLEEPVSLYLMPRFLVILQGAKTLRKIPLEAAQQIGAFRRLDQAGANGLVRFRAEEETLAFALDKHELFAEALAEAAKRTLEEPVFQKQKKKYDEDEDDDFE